MTAGRSNERTRRLKIMGALAAVLVVAAAGSQLLDRPAGARNDIQGNPVLPGFAAARAEASAIRITLADDSYGLYATPEGWRLEGTDGYPIRADRLAELAGGLETLAWDAPRTRDPAKMNAIGLGDPREGGNGALVEVVGPDGEVTASLLTGRKDEHIYVRRPDDMQAFRVTGSLPPLYSAEAWLDLDIIDIQEDAVSAVRLTDRTGASLFLQRTVGSSDRAFRPAPPYQDYELVNRLVTTGPALALTRFQPIGVKPAARLKTRPTGQHITQTHDGLEVEVRPYREADGYYVTLRAIEAGEGAHRGQAVNARAGGWAFRISEVDWMDFTPAVSSIARAPEGDTPLPDQPAEN